MLLLLCCLLALPAVAYLVYPPFRNTVSFAIWQFGLRKSPDLTQAFIEMPNTKIVASVRLSGQEHLEFFRQIISQLLKNRQELSKQRLDLLTLLNDAQLSGLIPDPVKASVLEEEKKYSTGTENLLALESIEFQMGMAIDADLTKMTAAVSAGLPSGYKNALSELEFTGFIRAEQLREIQQDFIAKQRGTPENKPAEVKDLPKETATASTKGKSKDPRTLISEGLKDFPLSFSINFMSGYPVLKVSVTGWAQPLFLTFVGADQIVFSNSETKLKSLFQHLGANSGAPYARERFIYLRLDTHAIRASLPPQYQMMANMIAPGLDSLTLESNVSNSLGVTLAAKLENESSAANIERMGLGWIAKASQDPNSPENLKRLLQNTSVERDKSEVRMKHVASFDSLKVEMAKAHTEATTRAMANLEAIAKLKASIGGAVPIVTAYDGDPFVVDFPARPASEKLIAIMPGTSCPTGTELSAKITQKKGTLQIPWLPIEGTAQGFDPAKMTWLSSDPKEIIRPLIQFTEPPLPDESLQMTLAAPEPVTTPAQNTTQTVTQPLPSLSAEQMAKLAELKSARWKASCLNGPWKTQLISIAPAATNPIAATPTTVSPEQVLPAVMPVGERAPAATPVSQ